VWNSFGTRGGEVGIGYIGWWQPSIGGVFLFPFFSLEKWLIQVYGREGKGFVGSANEQS
jgi:hypothetical protein